MKKPIRVAVAGAGGRMGQEIVQIIEQDDTLGLAAKVERNGGADWVRWADLRSDDVDMVIDFTGAEAFQDVLMWCHEHGCPLVSGTTGLSESNHAEMKRVSQTIPLFWAPNMSFGIALMTQMIATLAVLPDADFQVEEHHHRFKKDRPSGTAKWLQDELVRQVTDAVPEPLVVRGGGIFGVHRIYAMGLEETLTIEHTALNRRVFASGAVRAAKWLVRQTSGLYNMQSLVVGLQKA